MNGTSGDVENPFDVVVIGATVDGLAVAEASAARGARIALVDHDPSASRYEIAWGAYRRSLVRRPDPSGAEPGSTGSSARARAVARDRYSGAIQAAEQERQRRFRANAGSMAIFDGPARFLGADILQIGAGRTLRAEAFVLATGSRARRPAPFFDEATGIQTSEELLEAGRVPRNVAIIGADWSGCEWAFAMTTLGCSVQLIDRRTRLLRALDTEIRTLIQSSLHAQGVEIALGEDISHIERDSHGAYHAKLASGRTEIAESVLVLAGERGNTDPLALGSAGVATDPQGHVLIDDRGRSNVPSILAIGGVVDSSGLFSPPLTHALRVAGNALGANDALDAVIPWNLCTDPPAAFCGVNRESCAHLDLPIVVGRHEVGTSERRRALLEIIVDRRTTRLLGAQAAGTSAFATVEAAARAINRGESLDALLQKPAERPERELPANDFRRACVDARTKLAGGNRRFRGLKPK